MHGLTVSVQKLSHQTRRFRLMRTWRSAKTITQNGLSVERTERLVQECVAYLRHAQLRLHNNLPDERRMFEKEVSDPFMTIITVFSVIRTFVSNELITAKTYY